MKEEKMISVNGPEIQAVKKCIVMRQLRKDFIEMGLLEEDSPVPEFPKDTDEN